MPDILNVPADRPDDESPTRTKRPRIRVSARVAAVAGLSAAVIMGVVAPAVGAYIRAQVALARARCGGILTITTTPSTTTSTTAPGRYEITVTGVIGVGPQTLETSCRTGDRLVSYRYEVGRPTGGSTSRSVNVESNGRGVRLTYQVVGTVAGPVTSPTIVCRSA